MIQPDRTGADSVRPRSSVASRARAPVATSCAPDLSIRTRSHAPTRVTPRDALPAPARGVLWERPRVGIRALEQPGPADGRRVRSGRPAEVIRVVPERGERT